MSEVTPKDFRMSCKEATCHQCPYLIGTSNPSVGFHCRYQELAPAAHQKPRRYLKYAGRIVNGRPVITIQPN